jgi:pyruvate/2-oxoglutarate dehydrogenase complex dihydrolipoamide acyltransferase (E2) component
MSSPSTTWTRTISTLATLAALATASLSMGCGASPAYEPEPRMPGGHYAYPQPRPVNPEPMTSEELAAANQANGEIAVGSDTEEYSDTDPSALTEFKPALEGHGQWVDDSTYGTVWVPAESEVGTDFVPYTTAGHWTYDDSTSYVWVSDYSWGWAPFHYGRWVHVSRHGWAWIPGRTYSGAWVVWRTGGPDYEYIGWAPAGPDWYWYNGYAVGWTFGYTPYYGYCHRDFLYDRYPHNHVIRGNDPRGRDYEAHTRPYSPPPRTPANPTVGGGGRVAATPRVGPRPSEIGVKPASVVAPPSGNAGLARAQALASPHTAVAAGAAAPVQTQTRRRPFDHDGVLGDPSARAADARTVDRGPAVNPRVDAVTRSPQVAGVNPVPPRATPMGSDSRPAARSFSEQPGASRPTFGSSPSASASPPSTFRSSPTTAPSQPTFRSSPSVASPSSPTFRSAPSTPTFRSAPTQPTFHSAPSVSRSPSVSTPSRSSSPSVSRPSSSPSRSSSPAAKRR